MLLAGFLHAVISRAGTVAGWVGTSQDGVMEIRVDPAARADLVRLCARMGVHLREQSRYSAMLEFPDGSFSIPAHSPHLPTTTATTAVARTLLAWNDALEAGLPAPGLPEWYLQGASCAAAVADLPDRRVSALAHQLAQQVRRELGDGPYGSSLAPASMREEILATLLADLHTPVTTVHGESATLRELCQVSLERCELIDTAVRLARP